MAVTPRIGFVVRARPVDHLKSGGRIAGVVRTSTRYLERYLDMERCLDLERYLDSTFSAWYAVRVGRPMATTRRSARAPWRGGGGGSSAARRVI